MKNEAGQTAVMKKEEIDYCEADYVDFQYEYLQKHKPEGITLVGNAVQFFKQQ
jgi:hypothetical protein